MHAIIAVLAALHADWRDRDSMPYRARKGVGGTVTVEVDTTKVALFAQLFERPSIQAMLELSWQDFELFVAHVFSCAGYTVQHMALKQFPFGPGGDLDLYAGSAKGKPLVRVDERRGATKNLRWSH